jgi:hypothetical protein
LNQNSEGDSSATRTGFRSSRDPGGTVLGPAENDAPAGTGIIWNRLPDSAGTVTGLRHRVWRVSRTYRGAAIPVRLLLNPDFTSAVTSRIKRVPSARLLEGPIPPIYALKS